MAHDQHVGRELLDVLALPLQRLLDEGFVDAAQRLHDRQPGVERVDAGPALLGHVQLVGGDAHDQAVAQVPSPFQDGQMADVEHVERAEGDHGALGVHRGNLA